MIINMVCTANTCRSPMAEMMLRAELENNAVADIEVLSSGVAARDGSRISYDSAKCLQLLNIEPSGHRAKLLTEELYNRSDMIICMTKAHKDYIIASYGYNGKVHTLGELTGAGDIVDPYGGDENFYRTVAIEMHGLIKKLALSLGIDRK